MGARCDVILKQDSEYSYKEYARPGHFEKLLSAAGVINLRKSDTELLVRDPSL